MKLERVDLSRCILYMDDATPVLQLNVTSYPKSRIAGVEAALVELMLMNAEGKHTINGRNWLDFVADLRARPGHYYPTLFLENAHRDVGALVRRDDGPIGVVVKVHHGNPPSTDPTTFKIDVIYPNMTIEEAAPIEDFDGVNSDVLYCGRQGRYEATPAELEMLSSKAGSPVGTAVVEHLGGGHRLYQNDWMCYDNLTQRVLLKPF